MFFGIKTNFIQLPEIKDYWSRRIDGEHRLVYSFINDESGIVACGYYCSDCVLAVRVVFSTTIIYLLLTVCK
jgi:hypothetical protein